MQRSIPTPRHDEPSGNKKIYKIGVTTTIEYMVEAENDTEAYNKLHQEQDYLSKKYITEDTVWIFEERQ